MSRLTWLIASAAILAAGSAGYYYLGHGKETIRNVVAGVAVKSKIEKATEDAATTGVDVSGVDVALETGEGSVKDVTIDNPPGFSGAPAMQLGAVRFELDNSSVDAKGPLIIRSLAINAADIHFDQDKAGNSNLALLAASVSDAAQKALPSGVTSAVQRRVIIDNIYVRNIMLKMGDAKDGKELKRLHLSNIGRLENGVAPSLAAQTIIAAIAEAADMAGKQVLATR
jgi:hypothetical protein